MKKVICILLSLIGFTETYAQIDYKRYSQSYPSGTTDNVSNIGLITAVLEANNSFWTTNPNQSIYNSFSNNAAFRQSHPGNITAITTFDTTKAQFFLHGVNKGNAQQYEYRVVQGQNKVIVPWSIVTRFTDAELDKLSTIGNMAYLGGYKADMGDKIIVDVRKKSGPIIGTSVVKWVPIKPVIKNIYDSEDLSIFFKMLAHPWSQNLNEKELKKYNSKFVKYGNKTKLVIDPSDKNLIFYLAADIYNRSQIEYKLIKDGKIIRPWGVNDFDNNFVWLKNLSSGTYDLSIRYAAQREHVTAYPFEVETPWYQSNLFKIITGILICAFMGFIFFLVLHIKNKRQAEKELAIKAKLQLELKSIYAQLNPHFIFNALSSIQGLINKHDIKGANVYLSDFARLMRESLNNSNKEQVSLSKEILTLETYLKLEQLRFRFTYAIKADENINTYETEIPALLLQPIVENAIKHGVSALQEKGIIAIDLVRKGNNMIISITDNGNGFIDGTNTGFGLKLTQDRIKLLNDFNKGQGISFEIRKNDPTGTKIEFIFSNWYL